MAGYGPRALGLSALTLNINGVGGAGGPGSRIGALLRYLEVAGRPDVVFLQEVKVGLSSWLPCRPGPARLAVEGHCLL